MSNYLSNTNLNSGDRFFLILNNDNELINLKQAITSSTDKIVNKFRLDEFDFETIYYYVNDIKVIFVFAYNGITSDF